MLYSGTVVYLQYSKHAAASGNCGMGGGGEGLSNRELPTCGTSLHILKCGICLSYYRVFVLVISILCMSSLFCVLLYFDGLLAMVHL